MLGLLYGIALVLYVVLLHSVGGAEDLVPFCISTSPVWLLFFVCQPGPKGSLLLWLLAVPVFWTLLGALLASADSPRCRVLLWLSMVAHYLGVAASFFFGSVALADAITPIRLHATLASLWWLLALAWWVSYVGGQVFIWASYRRLRRPSDEGAQGA